MQGKIQKHQAFVAELDANESRVDGVSDRGKELIDAGHAKSDDIRNKLDEVNELWTLVKEKSEEKGNMNMKSLF